MKLIPKLLKDINCGEKIIFRGHADENWKLLPSIGRPYSGEWNDVVDQERKSLVEFKKRSIPYLKHKPSQDIEWLCLMQHHGCSTRLLDFTTNPLIALFFAADPSVSANGSIIVANYGRSYRSTSGEDLFNRTHSFAYHPPHITERIVGQSGCFVFSARPNKALSSKRITTIKIEKRIKVSLRNELNSIGINHSSLFPGLDGICNDLNDVLRSGLAFSEWF